MTFSCTTYSRRVPLLDPDGEDERVDNAEGDSDKADPEERQLSLQLSASLFKYLFDNVCG